jgi:perosamine synthetase
VTIPLSAPDVTEEEIEAVVSVLRTPALSLGPRLPEFERAFAAWAGAREAVAVSSGTAGLHLSVRALGLGADDEVITTPLSFVASVNALLYERARPVFVDVERDSLNLDPARIEAAVTPRTRAILPVHLFGQPAAMPEFLAVAERHGLVVIEDACEAVGTRLGGRHAGTFGRAGVFGFYPNKPLTTGEGGLVVTDDAALAALLRSLRNHGREDDSFLHARLGFNYRLSDLAAALGVVQVRRLPEMLAGRERAARAYARRLGGEGDLVLPLLDPPDTRIGWFAYVVRLADRFTAADRDAVVAALRARGIGCQRYFTPLHLQPHVREVVGDRTGEYPVAEAAAARTIALPFFSRLTEAQIDEVASTLVGLLKRA